MLSCVSSLIAAELDDRDAIHLFAPRSMGAKELTSLTCSVSTGAALRVMNKVIIHVANDATLTTRTFLARKKPSDDVSRHHVIRLFFSSHHHLSGEAGLIGRSGSANGRACCSTRTAI